MEVTEMERIYRNNIEWTLEEKDGKYYLKDDEGREYVFDDIKEVNKMIAFSERIRVPFSILF